MQAIHGGDIYRNRIQIDFSVNINPLGIPEEVKDALHQAVDVCMQYPDMEAEQLKEALSRKFCLPKTYFLPGNGASELFFRNPACTKAEKSHSACSFLLRICIYGKSGRE